MTKQYTKRERQMFVRQLKKARPLIERKVQAFVCVGISASSGDKNARKIREMIRQRINGEMFVSHWLRTMYPWTYKEISQRNQWKEYRLAWIDNMIEEFSQ